MFNTVIQYLGDEVLMYALGNATFTWASDLPALCSPDVWPGPSFLRCQRD
jgi:hypothetical protein